MWGRYSIIPYSLLSVFESSSWTVESVAYIARHLKWCFCRWSRSEKSGEEGL